MVDEDIIKFETDIELVDQDGNKIEIILPQSEWMCRV